MADDDIGQGRSFFFGQSQQVMKLLYSYLYILFLLNRTQGHDAFNSRNIFNHMNDFRRHGTVRADDHDGRCIFSAAKYTHIRYVDMADSQDRRRLGDDTRLVAVNRNQCMLFPV
mgnify:CR=1 FL=1